MVNRLDKNSKLPSGKSKESSSTAKSKAADETRNAKTPKSAIGGSAASAKSAASGSDSGEPSKSRAAAKPTKEGVDRKVPAMRSTAKAETAQPKSADDARAAAPKASARRPAAKSETDEGPGLEEFSISLIKAGETRERIWRTKNFQQMPVQRDFGFPEVAPELPSQFHQDKLVLMPKDPEYMFCYWELTPGLLGEKAREKVSDGNYRETLKINWESKSLFDPNFTFIPVFFWARKWYFGVPQVGQRYQVELGWLSETGHFISIIRSNLSELPESWAQTQKRLSELGDVLAYSARNTKILGGSEHLAVEDTRAFVPEWNLSSESFSSSSWSRAAGEAASQAAQAPTALAKSVASGSAPAKPAKKAATPKARLEVSGKVLPGTQVLVSGKAVLTDGQGFFKTEFPYEQDTLSLKLTDRAGSSRSFAYDLKELVLA